MSNMKTESLLAAVFAKRDQVLKHEIADGTAAVLEEMLKPLFLRLEILERRVMFLEAGVAPASSGQKDS